MNLIFLLKRVWLKYRIDLISIDMKNRISPITKECYRLQMSGAEHIEPLLCIPLYICNNTMSLMITRVMYRLNSM